MLFEISPDTTRSAIFEALNDEVGYFLNASITANRFGNGLFSAKLQVPIKENKPTRDKFKKLWGVIKLLSEADRAAITSEFRRGQFIQHYYESKGYLLPTFKTEVEKALAVLTNHLFSNTSGLVKVESACHETLHHYFDNFRNLNKNICCFCGSSELAQVRAGLDVNKQWRAANDHLLSKDEFPVFAVHPDNLIPICETCNSKAKLAKNLLIKKEKGLPDVRRLSFYPFIENCFENVGLKVEQEEQRVAPKFTIDTNNAEAEEKLKTWDDVYDIKARVEGKFTNLAVLIDNDCYANDFNDFKQRIKQKAISCKTYYRIESWNFWKYKLYEWLDTNGNGVINDIWNCIVDMRADADAAAIYEV